MVNSLIFQIVFTFLKIILFIFYLNYNYLKLFKYCKDGVLGFWGAIRNDFMAMYFVQLRIARIK
jgi:hypothetical protein